MTQLGVSRPTVRAALRALAAMGVVEARHGSGTYIPGGPPKLDSQPLSFLAALHGFTRDEMFETRRVLEVSAAAMAAERATGNDLAGRKDGPRWPLSRSPFVLETSVPGVFAAGDVRLDSMKRVASAVGEGAMSVYLVHRYLATV